MAVQSESAHANQYELPQVTYSGDRVAVKRQRSMDARKSATRPTAEVSRRP